MGGTSSTRYRLLKNVPPGVDVTDLLVPKHVQFRLTSEHGIALVELVSVLCAGYFMGLERHPVPLVSKGDWTTSFSQGCLKKLILYSPIYAFLRSVVGMRDLYKTVGL